MNELNLKEIISRNDKAIAGFIQTYQANNKPILVSFRNLLPEIKNIDRYTHLIHSYPAKLLVHIPFFFINNNVLSKKGDTILDSFNGTGTVMLEGILAKRNTLGVDANPLANLIAEVKVSKLDTQVLKHALINLIQRAKRYKKVITPEVMNSNYWFSKDAIDSLSKIFTAINRIKDNKIRNFFLVSFSNCIRKVSYADPRVSVPVRLNAKKYEFGSTERSRINKRLKYLKDIDVFEVFKCTSNENIKRFDKLASAEIDGIKAEIISTNARKLTSNLYSNKKLRRKSVQLIISSPPYAGAQKYVRASALNLGWTNLSSVEELKVLDKNNIGRENFKKSEIKISSTEIKEADALIEKINKINPVRATIICTYLNEMKEALDEMYRVLKIDGYLVLIIGNNKICNFEFNTQQYFTEYLIGKGLSLQFKLIDDIKSYGLMTKRNKTADIISREWILVFRKTN